VVCELVTDDQGVIASAAAGAAALFAVDEKFLVGKPLASFVAGRDLRRFRRLLLELLDGQEAELSLALAPRHHDDIAASVVASRSDGRIRWTVRAEEAIAGDSPSVEELAHGERWAVRLLTRLPQALVVVDRQLLVVFVNPASRRLLPAHTLRVGEPLPDPWSAFPLREHARTLFTRRPAVGRRVFDAGGRTLAVEGLISSDGQTATLEIADVTRDERMRRAEREFVENAAHELRTPIAAILSVVDALDSGAKDEPAVRDQFLRHIRQQADRLSRLATSLLQLGRMRAGVEKPHLDLVPAKPLLEEAVAQLEPAAGVAVRVEADPKLAMLADRDLLRHAVDNVAANAVRHTREGEIVLLARDAGHETELEIRDTGSGMRAEDLERAFTRLHRSSESGGAGLGLPIAKEAVEALGGTIEIESEPGAGTRVRMRVPTARLLA
jgi:signal transduction histidine kinase